MRVEVLRSNENDREEKYGIRLIHNGQCIELYARSVEVQDKWIGKLRRFCIMNTYSMQYMNIKLIGEGSFAKVTQLSPKLADEFYSLLIIGFLGKEKA